jgi:hypothetical protein
MNEEFNPDKHILYGRVKDVLIRIKFFIHVLTTRLYGRVKDVFIRIKLFSHLNYQTLWESKGCV